MKNLCLYSLLTFLSGIFCIIAAGLSGCSGSVPASPSETGSSASTTVPPSTASSAATTPSTQSEEWSADGVIKEGEYTGSNNYGDYTVFWRNDGQYIYIGMTAKTTGWVAMAVQPGSKMKDADMVMGLVKDGKAEIDDLYSAGDFGPHVSDTELGGNDDIVTYGGKEEGGFTTIEFKRLMSTGDKNDIDLTKGVNKIIWAYGSDDNPAAKHSVRGYGEIVIE